MDNSLQIKLQSNIFYRINILEQTIQTLETKISRLDRNLKHNVFKMKSNLINFMQTDSLNIESIFKEYNYIDLAPNTFHNITKSEHPFLILDVSKESSEKAEQFKNQNYYHIPFDQIKDKHGLLPSKIYPTIIISQDGTKSILACEELYKLGFYAIFNVSGGYNFI
ncbi:rhodanese-like domain-containing protein [Bacteriovoracaceae bacterium]|nr:rhodanese-like domain-containing protein [Bacteriovoracaceae bacterium]